MEHVTIAVSGANGGETVDFRRMAERGMVLMGRAGAWRDGVLEFAPDLAQNIARAMPITCRCSTRPTPMPRATASTCPKNRRRG